MTSETSTPAATSAVAQTDHSASTSVPADTSSTDSPMAVDTQPVHPPKPIDWAAINARIAKDREEKAKNLVETRANLRATLMGLGVTKVIGEYDGYGDSGNTEYVGVEPLSVTIEATLDEALTNFIWDMAYHQSPGLEINDGAFGTLEWDVANDTIAIEHNERIMTTELTTFEDL